MIVRRIFVLSVVMVGLTQATPAQAQFVKKIVHSIVQDTKRNNCWPNPFIMPDRQAVRTPIAMMVEQGWKCQNLLGNFYFDPDSGDISEAGEFKIRWIATQVASPHRVIFVSPARTPAETVARIKAVEAVATKFSGDALPPRVTTSDIEPGGWPASQVDSIGRRFTDGMPDPVLPDYERSDNSN